MVVMVVGSGGGWWAKESVTRQEDRGRVEVLVTWAAKDPVATISRRRREQERLCTPARYIIGQHRQANKRKK